MAKETLTTLQLVQQQIDYVDQQKRTTVREIHCLQTKEGCLDKQRSVLIDIRMSLEKEKQGG